MKSRGEVPRVQNIGDEKTYKDVVEISAQSVARHVRNSLIQIQQLAALSQNEGSISSIAETTIHLLDVYALLQPQDQLVLELEPVSIGAIVQDVMHKLDPLAKEYNCALYDSYSGGNRLVVADKKLAHGALLAIAHAFIESATSDTGRQTTVLFGTRAFGSSQKVGVFSEQVNMGARELSAGRKKTHTAVQQYTGLIGSGRGLLLADSLLKHMNVRLQSSSYKKLSGVAAMFQHNTQLNLFT